MSINSVVGQPMVNAGTLYINGMKMFWIGNTTFSVFSGACREANNENDIVLGSAVTVSIANQGVNGIDIGTVAASTFYAVYAIGSSLYAQPAVDIQLQQLNGQIIAAPLSNTTNNSPPACILSTNTTAPQLPFGYDMYRRIGFILTDGSSHIREFWQTGTTVNRKMWYDTAIAALSGGVSATYVAVPLTLSVPFAVGETEVTFDVLLTPTAAGNGVNLRPAGSVSTNGVAIMTGDVAAVVHEDSISLPATSDGAGHLSVDYKVVGAVTLNVVAYVDNL